MPIYEYKCATCDKHFTEFKKLADYKEPALHTCGEIGGRVISKPMIAVDYPAYQSPASGKWINGRKEHEAELKRTNCRILEPGETQDFKKRQGQEDVQLDKMLDNTLGEILTHTKLTQGEIHV